MYQGLTYNKLGVLHLVAIFFLVVIFEVFHYKSKQGEVTFTGGDGGLIYITKDEFNQRLAEGENLALIEDLVVDLSKYKFNHPGGKFVLEHNIGRDISKFFYGSYMLENDLKPHVHSNIARNIVNELTVGKLVETAITHTMVISASQVVNSNCKTFILRSQGAGHKNFVHPASDDMSSFGRHYMIRTFENPGLKR